MVAAKRQKTLHPTSTPSLLHAKLSVQPLPEPSIVGGEVIDNNSGPLVNGEEEEAGQNVEEPVAETWEFLRSRDATSLFADWAAVRFEMALRGLGLR